MHIPEQHDPFAIGGRQDDAALETAEGAAIAAVNFEAWPEGEADRLLKSLSQPRYNKDMATIGIELRMAALTFRDGKEDLVKKLAGLDDDDCEAILDHWKDTSERLRALADLVDRASLRWLAALLTISESHTAEPVEAGQ